MVRMAALFLTRLCQVPFWLRRPPHSCLGSEPPCPACLRALRKVTEPLVQGSLWSVWISNGQPYALHGTRGGHGREEAVPVFSNARRLRSMSGRGEATRRWWLMDWCHGWRSAMVHDSFRWKFYGWGQGAMEESMAQPIDVPLECRQYSDSV